MYKNLSPTAIGILGRQSELVEIALTHRFKGLEVDISDLIRRAQASSVAQACRYLCSAPIKIGGFELPIRWEGDEKEFQDDMAKMATLLEICQTLRADRCYTTIRPTSDLRPFHENFQFHVHRLQKVADALAGAGVKLGLSLVPTQAERSDGGFQFIHQVDPLLLLVQTIQRPNVGVLLDVWNWWVGGGDLEKLRALSGEQVVSVRLADLPAGVEPSAATLEQRLMPGEGVLDLAAAVALLDELGYDGPVALAPHPGLFKGQTRESIVSRASAVLDTLLESAVSRTSGRSERVTAGSK
jgi:sugar phosphate isomerase/epimerase